MVNDGQWWLMMDDMIVDSMRVALDHPPQTQHFYRCFSFFKATITLLFPVMSGLWHCFTHINADEPTTWIFLGENSSDLWCLIFLLGIQQETLGFGEDFTGSLGGAFYIFYKKSCLIFTQQYPPEHILSTGLVINNLPRFCCVQPCLWWRLEARETMGWFRPKKLLETKWFWPGILERLSGFLQNLLLQTTIRYPPCNIMSFPLKTVASTVEIRPDFRQDPPSRYIFAWLQDHHHSDEIWKSNDLRCFCGCCFHCSFFGAHLRATWMGLNGTEWDWIWCSNSEGNQATS